MIGIGTKRGSGGKKGVSAAGYTGVPGINQEKGQYFRLFLPKFKIPPEKNVVK